MPCGWAGRRAGCATAPTGTRPRRASADRPTDRGPASGVLAMRISRSVLPRSRSICARPRVMRPCCAATKQSSIAWATRTPTVRPTMLAAPFSEWAARMHASIWSAAAGSRSSASSPEVSTCVWVSASSRNRSSRETSSRSWALTPRSASGCETGVRRRARRPSARATTAAPSNTSRSALATVAGTSFNSRG